MKEGISAIRDSVEKKKKRKRERARERDAGG